MLLSHPVARRVQGGVPAGRLRRRPAGQLSHRRLPQIAADEGLSGDVELVRHLIEQAIQRGKADKVDTSRFEKRLAALKAGKM